VKGVHHNSLDAALFEVKAVEIAHNTQRGIWQESWEVYLPVG
jgi:hypothetical protein